MARCYYLDYKHFSTNDPQVKYTCNPDYGEEYKKCPVYQNNR